MNPRRRGSLRGTLARLVAVLALVLGVLIVVAILGMVTTARDYRDGAEQARERQTVAGELLVNMLTAQSANRAYILLARGEDRAAYQAARNRYPNDIERLRAAVRGDDDLEASVEAVDRVANLWFEEARSLIRLVVQGRQDEARAQVNAGTSEVRFGAFQAEQGRLLDEIERERLDSLAESDWRRDLTLFVVVLAALLALAMVVLISRQVWRRVGGPVAALTAGVGRVTRGRLTDPVPVRQEAVRELADLVEGFNLMQREVREERDAVAAAARREAAQKTERRLWETVQQGLLPASLPRVPGLQLAARYQPSERALLVGGDFYDAVQLPDGRVAAIVGDIAGHGAAAAAQAAGLRFAWRTLVSVDPNPAAVLAALNVQMGGPEQRAEGMFASIVYALIDPRGSLSFAPAGHPPPFILTASICQPLEPIVGGPLLGVYDEAEWPVTHAALPPGATIVLYTDGLVEARTGSDLFGVERACRVLAAERRSALELRVARLVDAARRHEDERLRDDVVVLAIERPAPIPWERPRPRPGPSPAQRPAAFSDGRPGPIPTSVSPRRR